MSVSRVAAKTRNNIFYKWTKITYQRFLVLGTQLAVTRNNLNWWLARGLRNLGSKAYFYITQPMEVLFLLLSGKGRVEYGFHLA